LKDESKQENGNIDIKKEVIPKNSEILKEKNFKETKAKCTNNTNNYDEPRKFLKLVENVKLNSPIKNEIPQTGKSVSDAELMKIIKEERNFPVQFSARIKLGRLVNFYYKYWNSEFTDDENEVDTDDFQ